MQAKKSGYTEPQTKIVIERRIIVGEVNLDPYGSDPAIPMAMDLAYAYIRENSPQEEHIVVGFDFEMTRHELAYHVSMKEND